MRRWTCYHATKFWMRKIGLGIAELWVDKLGWGQIPFSQHLSSLSFGVYCGSLAYRQWSMTVSWICTDSLRFFWCGVICFVVVWDEHVGDNWCCWHQVSNMVKLSKNLNKWLKIQYWLCLSYSPSFCENGIWPHPNLSTHNSAIPNPIFIIQNLVAW